MALPVWHPPPAVVVGRGLFPTAEEGMLIVAAAVNVAQVIPLP
jgi:hypothetical protein